MLRSMLNLRCSLGHRHYAAEPAKWVGRDCGHTREAQLRQDGSPRRRIERCRAPLEHLIHDEPDSELPRTSGEVAGVKGLTTLGGHHDSDGSRLAMQRVAIPHGSEMGKARLPRITPTV